MHPVDSKTKKRWWIFLIVHLCLLVLFAIFVILGFHGIGIPCIFHKLTGLKCPGCGNSRAILSLLKLDFKSAFQYNLLFPLEFLYLSYVYCNAWYHYLRNNRFAYRSPSKYMDLVLLFIILLWGIVRNLLHI